MADETQVVGNVSAEQATSPELAVEAAATAPEAEAAVAEDTGGEAAAEVEEVTPPSPFDSLTDDEVDRFIAEHPKGHGARQRLTQSAWDQWRQMARNQQQKADIDWAQKEEYVGDFSKVLATVVEEARDLTAKDLAPSVNRLAGAVDMAVVGKVVQRYEKIQAGIGATLTAEEHQQIEAAHRAYDGTEASLDRVVDAHTTPLIRHGVDGNMERFVAWAESEKKKAVAAAVAATKKEMTAASAAAARKATLSPTAVSGGPGAGSDDGYSTQVEAEALYVAGKISREKVLAARSLPYDKIRVG